MLQAQAISRSFSLGWAPLGWALGGPFALGALTGMRHSARAMLLGGGGTAFVVLVTILMMAPALHLALALAGSPTSAGGLRERLAEAMAAAGRVQVGFAPAALFVAATAVDRDMAVAVALLAFAVGMVVGAGRLAGGLAGQVGWPRTVLLGGPWCLVAAIVGARLLRDLFAWTLA
jgi:hypothetical protein